MCSFLGLNFVPDDLSHLNEINARRGPDLTNRIDIDGHLFVHNLLSITGEITRQPFIKDQTAIMFNGEIYNYLSLDPEAKSDGEVLSSLYKNKGTSFVSDLDGEYAIVIYDFPKKEVIFITDPFATKPLWYASEDGKTGFASYRSVLDRAGFIRPVKVPANTTLILDMDTFRLKDEYENYEFDLTQHKMTYDDWIMSFEEAIRKRTSGLREKVFIGLSSGYDSGAIACELMKQGVDFRSYSIKAKEDEEIILQRHKLLDRESRSVQMINLTKNQYEQSKRGLKSNAEEFLYQIPRLGKVTPNEKMTNDKGAIGLYHISELANKEGYKIYLSGQGADEIFSDYGHKGQKIYEHSTFGGLYPAKLEPVFPWNSFYRGTQYSYLGKEENVPGALGIEGRYPFLDVKVVQEFLWLHQDLKNKNYKSVLCEYLTKSAFPFKKDEKVGFSCDHGLL